MSSVTSPRHWAEVYIGEPWINGAHDCWGFFRTVQRDRFGVVVPVVDIDATNRLLVAQAFRDHEERAHWQQVETPVEGDAVLMAHARWPAHVGVWVEADGGGVLHCIPGAGVVFSRPAQLVAAGWSQSTFYRHRDRQAAS